MKGILFCVCLVMAFAYGQIFPRTCPSTTVSACSSFFAEFQQRFELQPNDRLY